MIFPHTVISAEPSISGQVVMRSDTYPWPAVFDAFPTGHRIVFQAQASDRVLVGSGIERQEVTTVSRLDAALSSCHSGDTHFILIPFPSHPTISDCPVQLITPKFLYDLPEHPSVPIELPQGEHEFSNQEWNRRVMNIKARYPKVVLSRKTTVSLPPMSGCLVNQLFAAEPHAHHIFVDYLLGQSSRQNGWLSVSPERLFSATSDQIITEAIAGTTELSNAMELTQHTKTAHEHQWVVDWIMTQLAQAGADPVAAPKIIRRLARVAHLVTPISAPRNGLGVGELIQCLFPTPAVAGTPQAEAIQAINQLESDRGFYSGLFGIISPHHTEFIVLIRYLEFGPSDAFVRVGAGIVSESEPDLEWAELNAKIRIFGPVV